MEYKACEDATEREREREREREKERRVVDKSFHTLVRLVCRKPLEPDLNRELNLLVRTKLN